MTDETFASVWDALENDSGVVADMKARSNLLIALQDEVRTWRVSRAEAAHRLGVSLRQFDDLEAGRVSAFDQEALIGLAFRAGLQVRAPVQAA